MVDHTAAAFTDELTKLALKPAHGIGEQVGQSIQEAGQRVGGAPGRAISLAGKYWKPIAISAGSIYAYRQGQKVMQRARELSAYNKALSAQRKQERAQRRWV